MLKNQAALKMQKGLCAYILYDHYLCMKILIHTNDFTTGQTMS